MKFRCSFNVDLSLVWFFWLWYKEPADYPTNAWESTGIRVFGIEVEIFTLNEKKIEGYACPSCGYDSSRLEGYYYLDDDGDLLSCEDWDENSGKIYADPPEGYTAYPIYGPRQAIHGADAFNAFEWEETHMCPICKEEYSFFNSN